MPPYCKIYNLLIYYSNGSRQKPFILKKNPTSFVTFLDFDGDGSPDNIGFIIKKIKVWTDPTVEGYKYDGNFAVDYFLDLHSDDNYNDYCLSYLFTYRDFSDGVLGLAWVGDATSAGGICEIYRVGFLRHQISFTFK